MSDSARDSGPGRHRRPDPPSLWPTGPVDDPVGGALDDPVGNRGFDPLPRASSEPDPRRPPGRAAAALLDRLPAGLTGARVALGRHWWLPVMVALGALAVAVGAVRFGGPSAGVPVAQAPVAANTSAAASSSRSSTPSSSPSPSVSAAATVRSSPTGATAGTPAASSPATPSVPAVVVVDVVGHVRRPGVVRLSAGARVADAVAAAGGAVPGADVSVINLARPVTDGQQIRVGLGSPWLVEPAADGGTGGSGTGGSGTGAAPVAPTPGTPPGTGGGTAAPAGPLDLNSATVDQLDALPGVGPATAAKILAWRTEHGRFASVDDLDEVSGIGPAKLAELRPLVRV